MECMVKGCSREAALRPVIRCWFNVATPSPVAGSSVFAEMAIALNVCTKCGVGLAIGDVMNDKVFEHWSTVTGQAHQGELVRSSAVLQWYPVSSAEHAPGHA